MANRKDNMDMDSNSRTSQADVGQSAQKNQSSTQRQDQSQSRNQNIGSQDVKDRQGGLSNQEDFASDSDSIGGARAGGTAGTGGVSTTDVGQKSNSKNLDR